MSLDDIVPDDAGQAKGGRPPKQSVEERDLYGDPFCRGKDTEEYWERVVSKFSSGNSLDIEELMAIMRYTHIGDPMEVRVFIEKHGIMEFDWENLADKYDADRVAAVLRRNDISNQFVKQHTPSSKAEEASGGLFNVVGDNDSNDNSSGGLFTTSDDKDDESEGLFG